MSCTSYWPASRPVVEAASRCGSLAPSLTIFCGWICGRKNYCATSSYLEIVARLLPMDPISVRDVKADGNARIHVGNSSITHVHNYAEPQGILLVCGCQVELC